MLIADPNLPCNVWLTGGSSTPPIWQVITFYTQSTFAPKEASHVYRPRSWSFCNLVSRRPHYGCSSEEPLNSRRIFRMMWGRIYIFRDSTYDIFVGMVAKRMYPTIIKIAKRSGKAQKSTKSDQRIRTCNAATATCCHVIYWRNMFFVRPLGQADVFLRPYRFVLRRAPSFVSELFYLFNGWQF